MLQSNRDGVFVRVESLGVREYFDDRSENGETFLGQFLRGDVFEEGERRYSRVLLRVAVRREGVIRSRGVISASAQQCECQNGVFDEKVKNATHDSGE